MTVAAGSVISDAEIVGELRAAWAEVSRGYARCWAAMAQVARRTTTGWESAEIAAALTFTARRVDYELGCAVVLVKRLPRVYAALAAGELDHHKARVFCDYLSDVTPAQAERICARLVALAPGWTTGQLATRLLREVHAIDPDDTRQAYQRAVRERAVHGYLDHTGTAVLTGSGLPAADTAAAAARLETLADDLRAGGYPATINQTRADLYLRLLDGTLDGLTHQQILATMLRWGPVAPADGDHGRHRTRSEPDHQPLKHPAPHPPVAPDQPAPTNPHPTNPHPTNPSPTNPSPTNPHPTNPHPTNLGPPSLSLPNLGPPSLSATNLGLTSNPVPRNPVRAARVRPRRGARRAMASRCGSDCPPC